MHRLFCRKGDSVLKVAFRSTGDDEPGPAILRASIVLRRNDRKRLRRVEAARCGSMQQLNEGCSTVGVTMRINR
jgi:hypothetical protein